LWNATSGKCLRVFEGHTGWVRFLSSLGDGRLASASDDGTVRVWDSSHPSGPIHFYDLNNAVADVAWAPYSSTVFAAACEDSKVAVWDLAVNKKEPLCLQKVRFDGGEFFFPSSSRPLCP
jgi:dynein intermediate chain 1